MYNVLVCDDEKDIVSALRIYLTSEGYQVYEAYNGKEAIEIIKQKALAYSIAYATEEEIDSVVSDDALTLLNFYTNYRKDIITPGTKLYELKQEYDAHPTMKLRRKKHEHE